MAASLGVDRCAALEPTGKDRGMDEARIDIAAPAADVYALVSDVTNMGRWSPETHKVEWVGDVDEPVPGARFKGWNHASLWGVPIRWSTTNIVRRAARGGAFSFDPVPWGALGPYRIEPTADAAGCTVVETREEVSRPVLARLAWLSPQVARERR